MELSDKINTGREYRRMVMEVAPKENEADAETYTVRGYATTFNERYVVMDWGDEILDEEVDAAAFANTDMSDVIMQYDHTGRVFARTSNETLQLRTDDHGLLVEAYLGGTEIGKQVYSEIKGGYTNKMSFGFRVGSDEITQEERDGKTYYHRRIKSFSKLYDVSAVSIPANDGTEISARSFCDGAIAKAEAERLLNERRVAVESLKSRIDKLLEVKK